MADTQVAAAAAQAAGSNQGSARMAAGGPFAPGRIGFTGAIARPTALTRATTLAGRALFSAIFIMSVAGHFRRGTIAFAASQGVPFAGFLVPASGLLALAGGLSVLLGYRTRLGAWALVLFLVPVTVMLHNFWVVNDPMMRQMQMAMFMKNVALTGGALLLANTGAGPVSLDARREAQRVAGRS